MSTCKSVEKHKAWSSQVPGSCSSQDLWVACTPLNKASTLIRTGFIGVVAPLMPPCYYTVFAKEVLSCCDGAAFYVDLGTMEEGGRDGGMSSLYSNPLSKATGMKTLPQIWRLLHSGASCITEGSRTGVNIVTKSARSLGLPDHL